MRIRRISLVFTSCFLFSTFGAAAQSAASLSYDGDGNLASETVNGVTTQYLTDDLNPTGLPQVMEETVNGVVQRRYTYGLQRISETQLINGSWVTSYYVYDGQGNVRALTNPAGIVTDTFDYDVFGNLVNHTGTTPNVYLYKGERYDANLGMYYMRARWYNPATGRFMSRDPEEGKVDDPGALHKYLYARGDPVNRKDPKGMADLLELSEGAEEEPEETKAIECAAEWARATAFCTALLLAPNPLRGQTGGYNNVSDCARGYVSEYCGGNPVQY